MESCISSYVVLVSVVVMRVVLLCVGGVCDVYGVVEFMLSRAMTIMEICAHSRSNVYI